MQKLNNFDKKELRVLSKDEIKRIHEIHFWLIISQIASSSGVTSLPINSTIPKLLAGLFGLNIDVIDHAFNTLNLLNNRPTNDEIVIAMRYNGVPVAKSIFTKTTFYKKIDKWIKIGQPVISRVLSDIQYNEIIKFVKRYNKSMFGKRTVLVEMR